MNEEGVIIVELDEVLDPRAAGPNARVPGTKYHFLSIKKQGQGTAELFVTEELWNKARALAAQGVGRLALHFGLNKFRGQFEPRLKDLEAVA